MSEPDSSAGPIEPRTRLPDASLAPSAGAPRAATTPVCPFCGADLRPHRHRGVSAWWCPSCGAAILPPDAASTFGFVPAAPPETARDYAEPQPQRDHGHVSGRPRPLFAPTWGLGERNPTADGRGLLR